MTALLIKQFDIAIIGGGASGCYLAALLADKTDARVALLESGDRLGRKLSATGNGQGNLTNEHISAEKYFGGKTDIVRDIVGTDYKSVLSPFNGIFTADSSGRVYPAGRQASSLTDALRRTFEHSKNIEIMTSAKVTALEKGFIITCADGRKIRSRFVVLCAGGKAQKQLGTDGNAYELVGEFGHKITPLFPALVQLKTDTTYIKTLRGLRADCVVTAFLAGTKAKSVRGDVIFADYGVTGNAVFTVSSYVTGRDNAELSLAFLPNITEDELTADISRKKSLGYATEELLACTLNNQIGRAIIKRCGSDEPNIIAKAVKDFRLKVVSTLGFDYAQVTRGGISMEEVKANLESKLVPDLFFAGEILDVDGECGGYNLHWAFSCANRVLESLKKRL